MKHLDYLNTFIHVAKHQSFHKTAELLKLSPTTVSKQIKVLEAQVEQELFFRSTRQVELTEFGSQFLIYSKLILEQVGHMDAFINSKQQIPTGKLHIICSPTLGKPFLLNHLPEFSARYPEITYDIEFTESPSGQRQQYSDIYFAYTENPGITDDLRARHLFDVKNILCAAPDYIARYGAIESISDLHKHRILTLNLRKHPNKIKLADGTQIETPEPFMIMDNFMTLLDACRSGMGVTLSADYLIADDIKTGKLVSILPDLPYLSFKLYLFYRTMKFEVPAIRAFVDYFNNIFKTNIE